MAEKTTKKKVSNKKTPQYNGKNGKGQFVKGNTAGNGKMTPAAKQQRVLTNIFKSAVTEADILAIKKAMVKEAKKGNVKAAQLVLDRCFGKAVQPLELGGEGGGPLQVNIVDYRNIDDTK